MKLLMENWRGFVNEIKVYVHGYVKPIQVFHTLEDWKLFVSKILQFQKDGHYVTHGHGKLVGPEEMVALIKKYYGFHLDVEVERYDLLTTKNVLDHIEDFVNHRFWTFEKEYGSYFDDIGKLKFAFFYSRGDMEPYVLIDEEFTKQVYGSTNNPKTLYHYTTEEGIERISKAIENDNPFDISAYTVTKRPFFRKESNKILEFEGNVRVGFRSDVKSYSVSNNRKCVNLYRLGYPGDDKDNLCHDLDKDCNGELRTSLWNEFIATPIKILGVVER